MQVSYIKCDICYNETTDSEKYFVETRKSETVCEQYDICSKCQRRIDELIQQIRHEERKFTILGGYMINVFKQIKCENCGKEMDWLETQYIRIGKEKYKVCLECKKLCNKFKQRHKI